MATSRNDALIELRVSAAQKQLIETAAAIEARSITEFSLAVLTEQAEEVIQRARQLRSATDHVEAFRTIMDGPAQSVEGVRDLLTRTPVFVDRVPTNGSASPASRDRAGRSTC